MSFIMSQKLPTPKEIIARYPVPQKAAEHKLQWDKEISDVITGKSDKFLVIIGPCSADNEASSATTSAVLYPYRKKSKIK